MVNKSMILLSALALTAFVFGAPTAVAIEEPNIGCGGNTIEICAPVCIQGPCYPYVCVHTTIATSICVAP